MKRLAIVGFGAVPINYLNTDLDVVCDGDLTELVAAFEDRGLYPIHEVPDPDGGIRAGFEFAEAVPADDVDPGDPDGDRRAWAPWRTIGRMLDVVESLPTSARERWNACRVREFNIGYECGDGPWAFNQGLDAVTLGRMASLGAGLRITLYPPAPRTRATGEAPIT